MKVSYRYINRDGKKRSGVVEAATLQEAKERLGRSNTYVISMKQKRGLRKKKQGLSTNQIALFTSSLAHLLNAGIPLYESLLSLEEQHEQETFASVVTFLAEKIKEGSTLAQAMKESAANFSPLYISMVEAGESVGTLGEALEKLSKLLSKQNKFKKQLLTAMLYPLILLTFSALLIVILLTFVVPSLEALFQDLPVNAFTRVVFVVSHLVTKGWPIYLPLAAASAFSLFYYFKSERGQSFWQKMLLRTPIVKNLIVESALARFCRTMGTLLEGGVSIISALQIARSVMRQPILEETIAKAEKKIVEGSLLSQELSQASWVPALVPRMLSIGEESGGLALMLGKIADLYEDEVEKLLTRIANLAQPVILIFLGSVVGLIMLAILLPLTDVSGFMGGF